MAQLTDHAGIYLLTDGRYRVRATATCPKTGKTKEAQRTLRRGKTVADALAYRDELKARLSTPKEGQSEDRITTVFDWADRWIERKARKLRASTEQKYRRMLIEFILPELGHIPLDRLTRRDISEWIMWAERQRMDDGRLYARATAAGWWRCLRSLLRDAHAHGYLEHDLTMRHDPPDTGVGGRQEKKTLSADQLFAFVWASRLHMPTRWAEIATLAYTGMRLGELYALSWDDVDLDRRQIAIERTVWRGRVSPSTKTGEPREAPLVPLVVTALREQRDRLLRDQHPALSTGLVFPADHGGYRYGSSLRKTMRLVSEHIEIGQRVTPQVLRRTFNTLLVNAQVDRIVLRSMMGHASEEMTDRYSGVSIAIKRAATDRVFGRLLGT